MIPSRDLRNHTAEVLRRVESGEEIEILHNNRPVAKLVPLRGRRQWIPAREVMTRISAFGPDHAGMTDELRDTLSDRLLGVSVVTLSELRLGMVSASHDPDAASRRLATYELARQFEPIPIGEQVSDAWALLVAKLRSAGRKAPINDTWIAATALAHDLPVATQENDDDAMPGLTVIKI